MRVDLQAIWHFDGIYATSRHIPGVRFAGLIHPGAGEAVLHREGPRLVLGPRHGSYFSVAVVTPSWRRAVADTHFKSRQRA